LYISREKSSKNSYRVLFVYADERAGGFILAQESANHYNSLTKILCLLITTKIEAGTEMIKTKNRKSKGRRLEMQLQHVTVRGEYKVVLGSYHS